MLYSNPKFYLIPNCNFYPILRMKFNIFLPCKKNTIRHEFFFCIFTIPILKGLKNTFKMALAVGARLAGIQNARNKKQEPDNQKVF